MQKQSFNDQVAQGISKVYGNPLMIWASIFFSICGAFVSAAVLAKMTYWSNAFQLVYCFVSVYLAIQNVSHAVKLHHSHKELHAKLDRILDGQPLPTNEVSW